MSTTASAPSTVKPICYYNFEAVKGKLTDLSGNGYDATLPSSGIKTVNDPIMGSCLQFKGTTGSFLKIENLPTPPANNSKSFKGLTMTTWVYLTDTTQNCSIIQLGTSEGGSGHNGYTQLIINGTTLMYRRWVSGSADHFDLGTPISTNTWVHLAVTVDNSGETIFYIDGKTKQNATYQKKDPGLEAGGAIGWGYGTIGADGTQASTAPVFKGMMAWAGFYQGVMSPQEIKAEMKLGQSNRHFVSNRSFPVDFKLFSDDAGAQSPIMFIESAGNVEQMLDFHILNTGKKPMKIPVGTDNIDATSNYHFQLRFRPGTLSENYVTAHTKPTSGKNVPEPLLNNTDWSTLMSKDAAKNDIMSFLYIGSTAMSLDAGQEFVLYLKKINASATGGSKNTNVEFKYQGIEYGSTSPTKIEGYRKQNISIVNHSGDKNIPLRAEIIGTANVMTYHQSTGGEAPVSELLFQLVNTGTDALDLGVATSLEGATKFTLSVDTQPETEFLDWALFEAGTCKPTLVLDVLGVVSAVKNNAIQLKTPLSQPLTANTQLLVTNDSGTVTVTVNGNGATSGNYTIPVQIPSGSTIEEGAYITPATGLSTWKAKGVTDAPPNQMQWTITNQSAQKFQNGEGLSFLLTGIECTLPTGTSTVNIGYSNIPGHWDGSFALPVQKSPVAFSQNFMGINTQEPRANLHIVEESGNVPLRIEKKADTDWPQPLSTFSESDWAEPRKISVINPKELIYFLQQPASSTSSTESLTVWQLKNAANPSNDVTITFPDNLGISDELLFYSKGYFYGVSVYGSTSDDGITLKVNVYEYESPSSIVYKSELNKNIGTIYSNDNVGAENMVFFNDCIYFIFPGQGVTTIGVVSGLGNENTAPALQYNKLNHTFTNYIQSIYSCGKYLIVASTASDPLDSDLHLFVTEANGSLTLKKKVNYLGCQFEYSDGLICSLDSTGGVAYLLDISESALSKSVQSIQKFQLLNTHQQTSYYHILHKGALIAIDDNNGKNIHVFQFNSTGEELLSTKTLVWDESTYITGIHKTDGIVSLTLSNELNNSQGSSRMIYEAEAFFNYVLTQNTLISSEAITIGANEIDDKASISVPYPLSDGYNGIAIGDTSTGSSAALSISSSHGSAVDPVAINDSGNPIFNIKQPTEAGEPYRVGIGTDNPKAPLHVASVAASANVSNYAFLWGGGNSSAKLNAPDCYVGFSTGANDQSTSIYTENVVQASQFCAVDFASSSDIRIKDFVQDSVAAQDLATLLKLQVSSYQYIDIVKHGVTEKKGLIAQQAKEVFPQAVNAEKSQFIPDIYAMATNLGWQPVTKQLRVSLEKAHDLQVGDLVRVLADEGFEEKEVVAVPNNKSFVVAEWEKPVDKLFVFGKEVHDFHTVDYDQVAMLGVSAIQAMHEKSESQEKRIDSLERENQSLKAALDELRQDLADFKISLSKQYHN